MTITPTDAQRAAANRLHRAALDYRAATRPIDRRATGAAFDAMAALLAAMDGGHDGSAYMRATYAAIDAAGTKPPVAFTSRGGGEAARAWHDTITERLAVDLAMLASGLDPEKVRGRAAKLAELIEPELDYFHAEVRDELTRYPDSSAVRAWADVERAAFAIERARRAQLTPA